MIMNGPEPKAVMKGMKGTLAETEAWHIINYLRSLAAKK